MTTLSELLNIKYPVLVAPMFLVSNTKMIIEACEFGATAAFPAVNYRTDEELRNAIEEIRSNTDKPFGVNLVVNKSNPYYKRQLKVLAEVKPDFILTSLGSPEETLKICKPLGIKIFCDVINVQMAQKVEALGADALIALNNRAGGHTGSMDPDELINSLREISKLPIIVAGGIGTSHDLKQVMDKGLAGASVGTIFLGCREAHLGEDYRQALIDYDEKDIVITSKLSGSPLTVINTPYVQSIGTKATFMERLMNKNKFLKKYIKLIIWLRAIKLLKDSTFKASYKTVWVAGPTIKYIKSIRPLKDILKELTSELTIKNSISS
jgi:nitronate monooxygenase